MSKQNVVAFPFVAAAAALIACAAGPQDSGAGKLDAEAAITLVAEEFALEERAAIHVYPELLQPGDDLRAYVPAALDGLETLPGEPLSIESGKWLVWIDDEPGALFSHRNRFVLVDCETGETTVSEQLWWPVLDGAALFVDPYDYEYDLEFREGLWQQDATADEAVTCDGTRGKALVINGWRTGETLETELDDGAQDMRLLTIAAGFETTYYGPQGTEGSAGASTPSALSAYFAKAKEELKPGDTFVLYLAGHGGVADDRLPRDNAFAGGISEPTLRRYLDLLDDCVNVVVVIDACRSGAFVDGLQDSVNLLLTSTNKTKPAYSDLDRSVVGFNADTNPTDKGLEFGSSLNGVLLDTLLMPAEIDRIRGEAEANGQSFWAAAFADAFVNAQPDDLAAKRGWSCPQSVAGNRGAGKTPEVTAPECTADPPDDDIDPPMPQPNACEGLPDDLQLELATAALLLVGGSEADAKAGICGGGQQQPAQNTTLHSDGVKAAPAVGEVDIRYINTLRTCLDSGGLTYCGSQGGGVPPMPAQTLAELPCGDTNAALTLCPIGPEVVTGDALLLTVLMDAPIPRMGDDFYQFAFVFDTDGDRSNNFRASDAFPSDFFDNTDRWFVATYDPAGFWEFAVTDATGGVMSNIASSARIIITGSVITLAMAPNVLDMSNADVRFTAFRHEGDFGASSDWSGDLVPTVAEGLMPVE